MASSATRSGLNQLTPYDEQYFGSYFPELDRIGSLTPLEIKLADECKQYVQSRFSSMKYILGMAIDFILLAQSLRSHDASLADFNAALTETSIFASYPLVTQRGERQSNTLTLKHGATAYGIRKFEELVLSYFSDQRKLGYPSAYVYNTGQWSKYKDLLVLIFQASSVGRLKLLVWLLDFGNSAIPTKSFSAIPKKDVGDFELLLKFYERSQKGENGGLVFQALAYGFATVVYGHLNLSASSVRTGSARQHRFGDIDAYSGALLVASIEVKDLELTESNFETQIGSFMGEVFASNVRGLVLCRSCSEEVCARAAVQAPTLGFLTDLKILEVVQLWDDRQQQKAIEGVLHFLANIEHNEAATQRVLSFLSS